MEGYLNQPEATAALYTTDGWFRTGDVACIDQAGGTGSSGASRPI